jgi:hypothetical protein
VDYEGSEQFVIVMLDGSAGAIKQISNPMTEQEAREFFTSNGESADVVSERLQSARDNKDKV